MCVGLNMFKHVGSGEDIQKPEDGPGVLRDDGLSAGWELSGEMMGSHSSPLKGQKALCIAESSLQLSKPCSDHVKK